MERVADVLGQKYPQFNTVSPNHSINDALYQMCCENVEYLIVLDDRKFLGVLTEHDIANKVLFNKKPLNEILVKDFMSSRLPVATVSDQLEYCMQLMERHNARFIALYDNFDFKGVLSYYDLMQQALKKRHAAFGETNTDNAYPWNY